MNSEKRKVIKYKKRPGTSAITASLYRSHLLGLILTKIKNEDTDFIFGCNVDEIGGLSEICFKFRYKNEENPTAVFIKTKYTGHFIDDDLVNPKNTFHLYKCYQSSILIKEKFDNDPDALFEGKFDSVKPYFIFYTPHQCNIKNKVAVLEDDKIYADNVNTIINTGSNNKIYKVQSESLVTDLINDKIKIIGNAIVSYITSDDKDTNEEMKNIFIKYYNLLIPHVLEINELNGKHTAKFNSLLHANNNSQIKLLREVLYTEILNKSKVIDEEAIENIQSLLETNEYTAELLSKVIDTVITFKTGKLTYMPEVSDCIKSKSLDSINVEKTIVDEAIKIAGTKALECFEIDLKEFDVSKIRNGEMEESELINVFKDEKVMAEWFLDHLYVYAVQVEEKNVGKQLLEEIVKYKAINNNATELPNKPDEVIAKFHFKVQDWMLNLDEPQYLTNSCDFWEDIPVSLSFLNYNCIIQLERHFIKFDNKSFKSFSKVTGTKFRTTIISNNVLLTSLKLMQYTSDKICSFVDFDHVCNIMEIEFNMLIEELKKTTVETLVFVFYDTNKYSADTVRFKQIVNTFPGNIWAVSNKYIKDFNTIYDTIKGLDDIYYPYELLKYEITVQEEKVELGKILDRHTVELVSAGVIEKIVKKETINIGKSLSNSFYNEIKDCFAERKLSKNHCYSREYRSDFYMFTCEKLELRPRTIDPSIPTFVAIYAEPGMGKSILLTHLAVKMKRDYPKTWVVKLNLLNYSEDFYKWKEQGADVDVIKSMQLVCKAELNNKANNNLFALGKGYEGDLIVTESNELDPIDVFHLKLIIHNFNTGNITFFLDGFDEICPYYLKTAVKFIKNIANITSADNSEYFDSEQANEYIEYFLKEPPKKNQVLITSRPYNSIITTLNTELNIKSLYLIRLVREEQYDFFIKYWNTRMKLEELSSEQFQNVEAFLKHAMQYRERRDLFLSSIIFNNMLLRRMQEAAIFYFRRSARALQNDHIYRKIILNGWPFPVETLNYQNAEDECMEELQLSGIPLHMKIHADIFVNQIKDTSPTKQWDMRVHTFEFHKRYLDIKLKKIRFEEKGGENVHTSAFLSEYEDLLEDVTEEHKKLAFYAYIHIEFKEFQNILPEIQWIKIQKIIEQIKKAKEKTGLIDRIDKGIPRFVHIVFADYYTVEFIADMLKNNFLSDDEVQQQMDFVVNCVLKSSMGIMTAFNHKLMNDRELQNVLNEEYARKCIFTAWMEQASINNRNNRTFLKIILGNGLVEVAWILLKSIKDTLNSDNIEDFVDLIGIDIFEFTIKFDELVKYVLDAIRQINPEMIYKALLRCNLDLKDFSDNELIVNNLRDKYKYPGLAIRRL